MFGRGFLAVGVVYQSSGAGQPRTVARIGDGGGGAEMDEGEPFQFHPLLPWAERGNAM